MKLFTACTNQPVAREKLILENSVVLYLRTRCIAHFKFQISQCRSPRGRLNGVRTVRWKWRLSFAPPKTDCVGYIRRACCPDSRGGGGPPKNKLPVSGQLSEVRMLTIEWRSDRLWEQWKVCSKSPVRWESPLKLSTFWKLWRTKTRLKGRSLVQEVVLLKNLRLV